MILIIGHSYDRALSWCRENGHPPPNTGKGAPIYASQVKQILGLLPDELVDLGGAEPGLRAEAEARVRRAKLTKDESA